MPVGAALSGGMDGSSIVMVMKELGGASLDLHTFSYIPEDSSLSEEPSVTSLVPQPVPTSTKLCQGLGT